MEDMITEERFFKELFDNNLLKLYIGLPAVIVKLHLDKNQVDVKPSLQRKDIATGAYYEDTVIKGVPFKFSKAGNDYVTMPIKVGDTGWLSFAQRDITSWKKKGNDQRIPTERFLDRDDAVFFPGICHEGNAIPDYDATAIVINKDSKKITIDSGNINAPEYTINCKQLNASVGVNSPLMEATTKLVTPLAEIATAIISTALTAMGIPWISHKHGGVSTGTGVSGGPQE